MVIGVCIIDLYLADSGSLKSKRQVLRKIKERIKGAFNVSISEIDHHDLWQRATLGVAIVGTDARFANRVLCKVVDFVHKEPRAEILDWSVEMR
jgi:uncharacterized protein YlxP (DUF503 family)